MTDLDDYIAELSGQGYHCSQIMMQLSLALRQQEDPLLIRSLGGLGGGMYRGKTCGTLIGASCVLASYVPRAEGEPEPELYKAMVREVVDWFETVQVSLECRELLKQDSISKVNLCPGRMAQTFEKVIEILESHGIDPHAPMEG